MQSRWNDGEASQYIGDLALRVYTSRLLGRDQSLVLHGGGNTSVKIGVNVLHPNAVFDTGLWTEEVLRKRAESYGMSVEAYKTNNVLHVEVTSRDVAELAAELCGPLFAKTTGAQIPVDGGNDRVI